MDDAIQSDTSADQYANYDDKDKIDDESLKPGRRALTTKTAVTFLLEGKLRNNVCRYCLNEDSNLTELDRIIHLAVKGVIYNVTVRDMIASVHPVKVVDDANFPNKMCEICLQQTLSSYLFVQQCERAGRALQNCFDDIYEKTDKLDPLERTKKRGRMKNNPNYNTIYTEHKNLIDYAEPVMNLVNINTELQDYKTEETNSNQHECAKCWQVYSSVAALLNHEKIHPSSMWFHCRVCGRSFAKRGQLKKHVLFSHSKKIQFNNDEISFRCKECGYESTNYSTHLEHIEKHKFKLALQNVVERKMDKLCSICLDKGNLKDLDQMICLHGGTPGLTGDVTLYGVLGSIIPNKNAYKYQELHIPTQAKVIKYIKKVKKSVEVFETEFTLSNPIIVTTKVVKHNGSYTFIFSKPMLYEDENSESLCNTGESNSSNEPKPDYVTDKDSNNKPNFNDIKFIFANPSLNTEVDTKRDEVCLASTPKALKSCSKCWIFGKPCEQCNNKIENATKNTLQCNYCWVFTNAKLCEICKSQIKVTQIAVDGEITAADKANSLPLNDVESRTKKSKWQCKNCLTNNTGEELKCACCESNNNLNNKLSATGFNFPESKMNHNLNNNDFKVSGKTGSGKDIIEQNHKVENEFITEYLVLNESTPNITQNTVDNIENTEMEVESSNIGFIEPQVVNTTIQHDQSELMDTEEHDLISHPQSDTFNTSYELQYTEFTQPKLPLQFHIGTGSASKTRKVKRPLRKIATSHS